MVVYFGNFKNDGVGREWIGKVFSVLVLGLNIFFEVWNEEMFRLKVCKGGEDNEYE